MPKQGCWMMLVDRQNEIKKKNEHPLLISLFGPFIVL
jgi:hypothetical protein